MNLKLLSEFKPALYFIAKFLALYFVGNLLYGFFIESYGQTADPVTRVVTSQTSGVLNWFGFDTRIENHPSAPNVVVYDGDNSVVSVFEGCNGINVMIVFAAFLFAYGGPGKKLLYFLPAGVIIIHLLNIVRIALLFVLAREESEQFYYYHKYFFTASLYLVVFVLWFLWITLFHEKRSA